MPRCPTCRSEDVRPIIYSRGPRDVRFDALTRRWEPGRSDLPIDETSPNWICMTCRVEWPDAARIRACEEIRGPALPDHRPPPHPPTDDQEESLG